MSETVENSLFSIIFYLVMGLIVIGVPRLFKVKTSREELGLKGNLTWTDIGLAVVGLFTYILISAGLTALFSLFPWFNADQVQDLGFNAVYSVTDRLFAGLTLVIIGPIAEEVIFRGYLYGKLRNHLHGKFGITLAIFIVSVLFGFAHGQWNVAVDVFAMSVIMCLQREITGTIYSGILVHMLKNALAFYLLYIVI